MRTFSLLLLGTLCFVLGARDVKIVQKGHSNWQIVLPDKSDHPLTERYLEEAALALQEGFFEGSGVKLPVVRESKQLPGRPAIHIGGTREAAKQGINCSKFRDFNAQITITPDRIFLAGRDRIASISTNKYATSALFDHHLCQLGSAKAVAEFMKRHLKTRFLMPGKTGTTTPAFRDLILPAGTRTITPTLRFSAGRVTSLLYDYANGYYGYGEFFSYGGHSYYQAVSAAKYGKSNPEYFRMDKDGKRVSAGGHLCFSNPKVQELFVQELVRRFRSGAAVCQLAQTDGMIPCLCPGCVNLGGPNATIGEKLWIVHRKVAEKVYKIMPEKTVHILSYAETALPPESFKEFPPNVMIELCSYAPEDFQRWQKIKVPRGFTVYIYNWGFYNQTGFAPKRTPEFVVKQAREFLKNRIAGVYRCGFGENFGLEGPSYYAYGQLLDGRKDSHQELFDEYCRFNYQEAASAMRAFHRLINQQSALYCLLGANEIGSKKNHLPRDPRALMTSLYPVPLLKTLESKLAAAEKVKVSPKVKKRLEAVRAEFNYLKQLMRALHTYSYYQLAPTPENFDKLAVEVKAFRKLVNSYFHKGKHKPFPGWKEFKLFAHSSRNYLLSNGRLSAGIGSPLCWNTDALKKANYLPGAKVSSLDVLRTPSKPEFNCFEKGVWSKAAWNHLRGIQLGEIKEKSRFKVLYDDKNIYFAFISELAPEKKHISAGKDGYAWATDCLEILIDPEGMREKFFHFIWNPVPDSTWDGAFGLIADPLHPKYDADDISWNGEWSYQTRREGKLWYSLVTLPYTTLRTTTPAPGTVWCLNTAREAYKPGGRMYNELSLWAPNFEDMKINKNRESLGEMHFK
ncbi:MAG: DUF4838 domain-containing protein [Lentisphaeria bacterium]|nr:DUF4838 domain-containing protein [Lentisphaeria bacterium]